MKFRLWVDVAIDDEAWQAEYSPDNGDEMKKQMMADLHDGVTYLFTSEPKWRGLLRLEGVSVGRRDA